MLVRGMDRVAALSYRSARRPARIALLLRLLPASHGMESAVGGQCQFLAILPCAQAGTVALASRHAH